MSQTRVSPEPLLVAAGFALMVPLVPVVLGSQDGDAGAHRAITAGALFGFGMVTKLTFLPWIAVVVLFRSTAHKLGVSWRCRRVFHGFHAADCDRSSPESWAS